MKREMALAVLLLSGAALSSAPALADMTTQPVQQNSGAVKLTQRSEKTPNTGGIAPDAGTTGSVSHDGAINDLLSAISDSRTSATAIGAMRQVSRVNVVKVSSIARGDDARSVSNAVRDNGQDRKTLQSAIRKNAALSAKLKAKKTSPSQIVAAKIEADGSVTIFAD